MAYIRDNRKPELLSPNILILKKGKRQIDLAALVKPANFFKVSTDYLPGNSAEEFIVPAVNDIREL